MNLSEWINLGVVLLVLGALMGLAEWLKKRPWVEPEYTRKLVHLGGGVVVFFLPVAFQSHWPVLSLAFIFLLITVLSQRLGKLDSVHGVGRKSVGAWVYPITVYVLFLLADGDALKFQIPILILAFSDAFGALVGKTYGIVKYKVMDQIRSLEGSTAFFVVAFLVTHIPLLLSNQTGRWEAVLIAFIIALLATCFEAISLGGSDNLLVPFGAYFFLDQMMTMDIPDLELRAWVLIGLLILALLTAKLQGLSASGAIGALLVGYAVWSLAGLAWFLPLLLFYLTFNLISRLPWFKPKQADHSEQEREIYEISAIFYISITSVVLVFLYNAWPIEAFAIAFLTTASANAAISWATLIPSKWFNSLREIRSDDDPSKKFFGLEWFLIVIAALIPLLPFDFIDTSFPWRWSVAGIILIGALTATILKLLLGKTLRANYVNVDGQRVSKPTWFGQSAEYQSGIKWLNTDRVHLIALVTAAVLAGGLSLIW